jgi:hypothetical protein
MRSCFNLRKKKTRNGAREVGITIGLLIELAEVRFPQITSGPEVLLRSQEVAGIFTGQ